MTEFMPKDYQEPKTEGGTWFRIGAGETKRVRIMGSFEHPQTAIMGWEAWTEEEDPETGKVKDVPIRKEHSHENYDVIQEMDRDGKPRHFWAIQIFNISDNEPQIWGMTQRTIQRQIRSFSENPNWGNPVNYVLAVTREGEGLQTTYTIIAEPPIAPPSDQIIEAMKNAKIDCREMFANKGKGENPFGALTDEESDDIPF